MIVHSRVIANLQQIHEIQLSHSKKYVRLLNDNILFLVYSRTKFLSRITTSLFMWFALIKIMESRKDFLLLYN